MTSRISGLKSYATGLCCSRMFSITLFKYQNTCRFSSGSDEHWLLLPLSEVQVIISI